MRVGPTAALYSAQLFAEPLVPEHDAAMEFVVSQIGIEVDTSWHARILQHHAATPYQMYIRLAESCPSDPKSEAKCSSLSAAVRRS